MNVGVVVELFLKPFYECADLASESKIDGIHIIYAHEPGVPDVSSC